MGQNRYNYGKRGLIIYYINKLPIIICMLAAIITGLLCYNNSEKNDTYIKMFTAMVMFGAIGFYARFMLKKIIDDLTEENNSEQGDLFDKSTVSLSNKSTVKGKSAVNKLGVSLNKAADESTINLKADEALDINSILKNDDNKDEDDFSPLTVSKVISKQMKNDGARK